MNTVAAIELVWLICRYWWLWQLELCVGLSCIDLYLVSAAWKGAGEASCLKLHKLNSILIGTFNSRYTLSVRQILTTGKRVRWVCKEWTAGEVEVETYSYLNMDTAQRNYMNLRLSPNLVHCKTLLKAKKSAIHSNSTRWDILVKTHRSWDPQRQPALHPPHKWTNPTVCYTIKKTVG
jgi:hypothetical protein